MGLIGYAEAFAGLYGPKPIEEKLKMNERIRELAVQAGFNHMGIGLVIGIEEYHQKFAELIVGECMRMCDVAAIGYESHNHFKEANGCYSAKEYIEEHFGVEE